MPDSEPRAVGATPLFDRLALIGIGLIGSSIARVARQRGDLARTVVGHARPATLERVRELGIVDVCEADAAKAVQGADAVIFCIPVGAFAEVMRSIAPHLKPGAIVSDVGSTKGSVVRDLLQGVHLVPAHPMAGTEHSGPDAGFAELFEGRYCMLTPLPGGDPAAVEKITEFWRRCGSMVETLDPATHDKIVAIVSHLPHLIAFTICSTADDLAEETKEAVLKFAAGGFRDFTRIAASDPTMWRDVFLNNREALLEMLGRFVEDAHALGRAVRWGQAEYIEDRIRRGRKIRRELIERHQA
jgi:cyclohexadieny/prephenate dehydrogenase